MSEDFHDDHEYLEITEDDVKIDGSKIINNNYLREYNMLKTEVRDLKDCQYKYLSFSITATALLLGLLKSFADSPTSGIAYLFPLVILLPAWVIFFDKAASITRIVSYLRLLEKIIYENVAPKNFFGWERALDVYRNNKELLLNQIKSEKEDDSKAVLTNIDNFGKFLFIIWKNKQYHYWVAVFTTFFIIPVICWSLSVISIVPNIYTQYISNKIDYMTFVDVFFLLISLFALIGVLIITIKKFYYITAGDGTYDINDFIWNEIILK
jgi:hypothetical protein